MKQDTIKIQLLNDTMLCVRPVLPDGKTVVPIGTDRGELDENSIRVVWGIHGHETEEVSGIVFKDGYICIPILHTMPLGVYDVHITGVMNGEDQTSDREVSDNRYAMIELVKYGNGISYEKYYTDMVIVGLPDTYIANLRKRLEEELRATEEARQEYEEKAADYEEKAASLDDIEGAKRAFDTMKRIKPYLYGIEYSSLRYESARAHLLGMPVLPSACTTVRSGAEVGRNFDWAIGKQVEFLVRTKAHNGRYATIGFCGALPTLTEAVVRVGKYRDEYRYLPFYMQDGMNSEGLVATIHQLPDNAMRRQSAGGNTPLVEERERVSAVMLVRYVLDNFRSAMEAAEYIRDFVRVIPARVGGKQLDCQYAIADKDATVYVAFEGSSVVIEQRGADDKFVMTNFRLAGTTLVDGVYDIEQSGIEDYGQGVERANAAIGYAGMDMIDMLAHDVNFTQAYTTGNRLTEFAGMEHEGAIATILDTEALQAIQESAAAIYQTEESAGTLREKGDLWQTVHSVVYDIEAQTLRYVTQEIDGDTEEIVVEGVFGDESGNADADKLAIAITAKGVPTNKEDSLSRMATNVLLIPQQINNMESDFGSFVAPSEYMWNVFDIARELQKNNPHPEMGAFFVAEYYRGFDSLDLTGAHAYMTCDGDYYAPLDKTAVVNHVWHDADNGKSNRYIVFFYMQDGYTFSIATADLCPRRVALSGRCSSFIVTGENRLTDVYVLGELGHFEGGTTGRTWNPAQVIRNYQEHATGTIYYDSNIQSAILSMSVISSGYVFRGTVPYIYSIAFPNLTRINGGGIFYNTDHITGNSLCVLQMDKLEYLNGAILQCSSSSTTPAFQSIKKISLPLLTEIGSNGRVTYASSSSLDLNHLEGILMPSLIRANSEFLYSNGCQFVSLIDVEVGRVTTNLNIKRWNPTDVIADPVKLAQLNANIRDHIAAKVSDRTGMTALTFTVSTNLYNNLEQATKDAFSAKNWRVAGV